MTEGTDSARKEDVKKKEKNLRKEGKKKKTLKNKKNPCRMLQTEVNKKTHLQVER